MLTNFLRILPWPLRLALLSLLAAPLINTELVTRWVSPDPNAVILAMASYAVIIWGFIIACVGWDKFFSYVSTAAVMCVATVVIGSAVGSLFGLGGDTPQEKSEYSEHTVAVLFMLLISLPYAFFAVQAFSASGLLERLSSRTNGSSPIRLHLAVWLRVFQYLVDLFPGLVIVWLEENPSIILPRNRSDWSEVALIKRVYLFFEWILNASSAWAYCLLVFNLRIVPIVDMEASRVARACSEEKNNGE